MTNFIKILDNVIPNTLADEIESFILFSGKIEWYFQPNISGVQSDMIPGFSHIIWSPPNSEVDISHMYFINQILYKMANVTNSIIYDCYQCRLFLQVPSNKSLSTDLSIHTDLDFPHYVCLYYVNDSDGDTIFYDNNKEIIKKISPKKGRVVLFDGDIFHTASIPSKNIRCVVNFDFFGKLFGKEKEN